MSPVSRDAETPEGLPRGSETILVADDEPSILHAAERLLTRLGYTVLTARNGHEVLDVCRRAETAIDLVILDVNMPGHSGSEAYLALRREGIRARVLFMSGAGAGELRGELERALQVGFLAKPWTAAEFAGRVRAMLDEDDDRYSE